MGNSNFSIADAKQMDLVDYLFYLGFKPEKISNQDYWYLSPFRNENTPSFKVNKKLNVWFDFGEGKGGNLVDFGVRYFKCSVSEFLSRIGLNNISHLSFHPPVMAGEKKEKVEGKIIILKVDPLTSKSLLEYLEKRRIPLDIAQCFCGEISFSLYNKIQSAIGFKNDAGGYELRSQNFKGSSSPKDVTSISNNAENISVFEGFFNFLSFHVLVSNKSEGQPENLTLRQTDFLILNSLSFFEKLLPIMKKANSINLYLDRDNAGITATRKAILSNSVFKDKSDLYKGFKDLNDMLTGKELGIKNSQRLRHRF